MFVVPAVGFTVQITVDSTSGMGDGTPSYPLFITGAGYFTVVTVDSGNLVTVRNVGATVPLLTVIGSGATIKLYYPDAVNQVTYSSDATWVWAEFQRTFVFPPSATDRNWNGVAVSWSNIASDPVFSRITPPTVTVGGDEELRVIYKLTVKIPKVATAVALSNGGFNAVGAIKVVGSYAEIFGGINSDGTQSGASAGTIPHILRGNGTPTGGYLLTNSTFPSEDTPITPVYAGINQADSITSSTLASTYTSGTFYRDYTLIWGTNQPVSLESDIRSFFLGTVSAPASGIQWRLSSDQTKTPTKSLSATFHVAWARP
jgi:hypothetical protein